VCLAVSRKRDRKEFAANEIGRLLGNLSLEQKRGRADSCTAAHGDAWHSVQEEIKVHEVHLEEIRAALNADFTEAMLIRERTDEWRLKEQRTEREKCESEGTKG
jgi:hypothetical protein